MGPGTELSQFMRGFLLTFLKCSWKRHYTVKHTTDCNKKNIDCNKVGKKGKHFHKPLHFLYVSIKVTQNVLTFMIIIHSVYF